MRFSIPSTVAENGFEFPSNSYSNNPVSAFTAPNPLFLMNDTVALIGFTSNVIVAVLTTSLLSIVLFKVALTVYVPASL